MRFVDRLAACFGNKKPEEPPKAAIASDPKPLTKRDRILLRLREQSYVRYLVLQCAHPLHWVFPDEIDESSDASLTASIRHYLEAQYETARAESQSSGPDFGLALVASGLLVYGRLDMFEVILDNLTQESYVTDHGMGICILLPYFAISTALPIPGSICGCTMARGGVNIQAAREWFAQNRSRLDWNAEQGRFVLVDNL